MNFKKIPSWVYALLVSILIVGLYKYKNKNKKNDSNSKYLIVFLVILGISFVGFSYFFEKKNVLVMPLGKQKGGGNQQLQQQVKPKNMEIDTCLPNF